MAEKTPSRDEAIRLMSKNPNLIKRPIATRGEEIVLGFDVTAYMKIDKIAQVERTRNNSSPENPQWEVRTIGVIGAGTMGRGIAYASALGGYRTILEM